MMLDFARIGRLLVWFSCVVYVPAGAAAQPAAALGAEQVAVYRRMFQAMDIEAVFRHAAARPPEDRSEQGYLSRYALAHTDSEEIFQLYLPVYARHVSTDSARRIVAFYQTEPGRKTLARMTARLQAAPEPELWLSDDEVKASTVFDLSIAARELKEAYADQVGFTSRLAAFRERYADQLEAGAFHSLLLYSELSATLPSERPLPLPPIEPTGNTLLDTRFRLAAQGNLQLSAHFWQTYADVQALHTKTALLAEDLVSRDTLADNRQRVDQAQQLLERFLATVLGALRANVQAMREVPGLDAPTAQAYARGMDKTLDWLRRFGDNLRARLDVARKISLLVESALGTVTAEAGRLQFANPADAGKYRQLQAQLAPLQAQAKSLEGERRVAFRASFSEPVPAGR